MSVVMIVEDDVVLRAQLSRLLHRMPNIEVIEAGTIRESIDLAKSIEIDLVVTDLHLPDGTALELFPHLLRDGARIPTLLISGAIQDYRGKLPSDVPVLEKPIPLSTLRDAIANALDCHHPSPFSLADYLQLAAFGRHSVQIDVTNLGDPTGLIVIRDGEPWTAVDELGEGMDALLRLMVASDLSFECNPVSGEPEPRTLRGSAEHVMFEAARLIDERSTAIAQGGALRAAGTPSHGVVSNVVPVREGGVIIKFPVRAAPAVPRPVEEPPRTTTARYQPIDRRPAAPTPDADFDRYYEAGIDALLRKRYAEALEAFTRAKAIRSTPTLEANLTRLRTMGVT